MPLKPRARPDRGEKERVIFKAEFLLYCKAQSPPDLNIYANVFRQTLWIYLQPQVVCLIHEFIRVYHRTDTFWRKPCCERPRKKWLWTMREISLWDLNYLWLDKGRFVGWVMRSRVDWSATYFYDVWEFLWHYKSCSYDSARRSIKICIKWRHHCSLPSATYFAKLLHSTLLKLFKCISLNSSRHIIKVFRCADTYLDKH